MCLSFSVLTNLYNEDEIKSFYSFVKKIDTTNETTISDYKDAWGLPENLQYIKTLNHSNKKYPHIMNINLPYDEEFEFLFKVYDESGEESTIDIIKKKSIVSLVLELTDLRFNDENYKANWTVFQIRKFKPYSPIQEFFMSRCFICDQDDPEDKAYARLIEKNRADQNKNFLLGTPPIPKLGLGFQNLNQNLNQNQNQFLQQQQLYFLSQFPQFFQMPFNMNSNMNVGYHTNQHVDRYDNQQLRLEASTRETSNQNLNQKSLLSTDFVAPSIDDLQNGIKMLKKTVTIDKSNQFAGTVVDPNDPPIKKGNPPPPPPLKKDTLPKDPLRLSAPSTKETKSISDKCSESSGKPADSNKKNIKSQAKITSESSSESSSESEPKIKAKSKTKQKSKSKPKSESDSEPESKTKSKSKSKSKSKLKSTAKSNKK